MERRNKDCKSVATMMGVEHCKRLLMYSGVLDESGLAPVWAVLAKAPARDRLSILQGLVEEEYIAMGMQFEHHIPSLGFITDLLNMRWTSINESVDTGSLANPYLFGDSNEEEAHNINRQIELINRGGAAPTLADTHALLKVKVILPGPNDSLRILRRMQCLLRVVLPTGHPLTVFLGHHYTVMKEFDPHWTNHMTYQPARFGLKGVLHLKYLSNKFNRFFINLNGGLPPPHLDPREIVDAIIDQQQWEPILSPAFEQRYRLQHFSQQVQPPPSFHWPGAGSGGAGAGGLGTNTTPPITPGSGTPRGHPLDPVLEPIGGPGRGQRLENTNFNVALFGPFKTSSIKAAALRTKIREGHLPALPFSKVEITKPMCLAWHTKAQCNSNCPCAYDHVNYNANEYTDLATWCVLGFAPPATQG